MRSEGPNKGNEIYCGKGIVAKAAKLEDVKAKLMKKGSAISPAHWSNLSAVQNQSKSVQDIFGLDRFKCTFDSLERFTFTFIN